MRSSASDAGGRWHRTTTRSMPTRSGWAALQRERGVRGGGTGLISRYLSPADRSGQCQPRHAYRDQSARPAVAVSSEQCPEWRVPRPDEHSSHAPHEARRESAG
eukprot:scaffold61795_cov81-Phaeocystis_antarctica.AAC.1